MKINLTTNRKSVSHVNIDKYPDECPYCHRGIKAKYLFGYIHPHANFVHLSFFCPSMLCQKYFLGEYKSGDNNEFYFARTLLGKHKRKEFSELISSLSASFVEIYNEASSAEENGLNQICGVGYRKALEFLIKDYIIFKDKDLKETVENLFLGKCINDYIKNGNIKEISKRAVWIGNDEAHYIRKWIEKNIADMKLLIDLTVHWIETEELTEKIIASMPE